MTKVMYNGKEIELIDELEPGFKELDLLTDIEDDLEDTTELDKIINTKELDLSDLNES